MPAPRQISVAAEYGSRTTWNRSRVHQNTRVEQEVFESKLRSALSCEDYARRVIEYARSGQEVKRREMMQRRRAMLHDGWKSLLIADLKNRLTRELWPHVMGPDGDFADISRNPARDIWREMAILYKHAAIRTTPGDPSAASDYSELYGDKFHTFWHSSEVDLQAMNDVAIWPTVANYRGELVVRHNIAAGDTMTVAFDEELGASEPYAVVFVDYYRTPNGVPYERYRFWTPSWRLVFDQNLDRLDHLTGIKCGDGADGYENPYGFLPFEFVHKDPYQSTFWNVTLGEDLVELTLKTGRFETDTDYLAHKSGHKQLAVSGTGRLKKPDKTLADPGAFIMLQGDGITTTLIDWQVNLTERTETSNAWEMRAAASRGINPERLRRTSYQTAESARLSERGLQERREEMEEVWRSAEQGYFQLVAIVAGAHEIKPKLDPAQELEVTYAPIEYPGDPERRLVVAEKKARLGVASLVQLVLEDHPSWDENQAFDFIRKNVHQLAEMAQIKQAAGVPGNDLANRSADDEADGATGPEIRDGVAPRATDA
jgi:hypothetical protein